MKTVIMTLFLGLLVQGCKNETIKEDLGSGFEISGVRDRGIYTITQDGLKVARIDLNKEHIDYSAQSTDKTYSGNISIPTSSKSGRGCAAHILIPNADGGQEGHQVLERRIMGWDPGEAEVVRGAGVYIYAPDNKESNKPEIATPRNPSD
jgi:hypothetical protein